MSNFTYTDDEKKGFLAHYKSSDENELISTFDNNNQLMVNIYKDTPGIYDVITMSNGELQWALHQPTNKLTKTDKQHIETDLIFEEFYEKSLYEFKSGIINYIYYNI